MEWIEKIDFFILDWIQQNLKGELLDFLMPIVTMLGDGGIFFILLSLALLCTKKYRKQGSSLLGGLFLCLLFGNLLLKPLFARIRPYDLVEGFQLLIKPLSDYSFPSGHTMASFACAGVFWHYRKVFGKCSAAAIAAAVLIGFSRLYLYVHFPTDVLCGALLGLLFAAVSVRLNEQIFARKAKTVGK